MGFSYIKTEIGVMEKYIKDLKTEIEAGKFFMKEQLYFLKASVDESNASEATENAKIIEPLQQQNQNLVKENASKNTIIKILAEIKFLIIPDQNQQLKVYNS